MASILRRWPLIERHSSTRCQTPISSSSSWWFSLKSLSTISLSPRLTTPKSCLFSSAPLCSRFPFFGDWKEFFSPSCWQIFLKLRTSSLQLRDFESTRYTFFENAVTKLRNVYFYHTSIFLENSFFHFHQRNHHLKSTKVWVVTYINMRTYTSD